MATIWCCRLPTTASDLPRRATRARPAWASASSAPWLQNSKLPSNATPPIPAHAWCSASAASPHPRKVRRARRRNRACRDVRLPPMSCHGSSDFFRVSQDEPPIIGGLKKQDGFEVELVTIEQRHVARRDPAKHATTLVAPVGIIRAVGEWPSIANIVEATREMRMEHDGCGRAARGPDLLLLAHQPLPLTVRATPATKPRLPT